MHIVFVTNDYPPLIGGMATHAAELSRALAESGAIVTVLSASELRGTGSRFRPRNRLRVNGNLREIQVGAVGIGRTGQTRRRIGHLLQKLTRSENPPDAVHLHELDSPPVYAPMTALPVVWTNHSSAFLQEFESKETVRLTNIVNCCDWITAPSRELGERVGDLGYPRERITYIPNGVDTSLFAPLQRVSAAQDSCIFVAARRFVWKNGLHVLLDAIALLPVTLQRRVSFRLAGDTGQNDEYAVSLRARIETMRSVGWDIRNLGSLPNSGMRQVYAEADAAVLPSFLEATSIAGLEAMAAGLPLIGSNVGGIPEIITHLETGLLCEAGDARALADQMRLVASDPELRRRLGQAARDKAVRDFSWAALARRYLDVYEQCIAIPSRRGHRQSSPGRSR